ncbi:hypothetical protein [Streptomyces justiciae]|uniref:hypothetical protein n=1 Tax=Streptomyces justiciae TaxID=2780140 RepID=UPI0021195134|nr:hypothetical protein [Streptomyces justiciae]MCW8384481.1 hypothetical protein [Streptomyces justiciae]
MKRKLNILGTAAAVASIPFFAASPAWAGPGEWDYLGSSTFYSVNGYYYSYTVNSGGGDFKICVTTGATSDHLYGLFEYDPDDNGLNSDEKIGSSVALGNGDCASWHVEAYVDGDNNRAELYVATQDSKVQSVKYWD